MIDEAVLLALNSPVGLWPAADSIIAHIMGNHLFKGNLAAMVVAWVAVAPSLDRRAVSNGIAAALGAMLVAMALARGLQLFTPFSPRPIYAPGLDIRLSEQVAGGVLDGWSSMPSDHAMMFVALAVGMLMVHRVAGLVLLAHAVFVICLPRVYFGLHWPSDILAGAAGGALIALVLQPRFAALANRIDLAGHMHRHASLAAAVVVFTLVQLSTMFEPLRAFVGAAARAALTAATHLI